MCTILFKLSTVLCMAVNWPQVGHDVSRLGHCTRCPSAPLINRTSCKTPCNIHQQRFITRSVSSDKNKNKSNNFPRRDVPWRPSVRPSCADLRTDPASPRNSCRPGRRPTCACTRADSRRTDALGPRSALRPRRANGRRPERTRKPRCGHGGCLGKRSAASPRFCARSTPVPSI